MPLTRNNPTNGNLEIFHDTLEAWVTTVADLPSVGGKPVQLSPSDLAVLNSIAIDASAIATIQAILGNNFYPEISQINSKLGDISSFKLQAIASGIDTLQASIDSILNQMVALSSQVTAQTDAIQELKDATVTLTPIITNLTLANANTQYAHTFPSGTKRHAFKCRGDTVKNDAIADVRYSWVAGMVATGINNYDVLNSSAEEISQDYFVDSKTIYFSSAIAGTVLTIRGWQ